MRPSCPDCARKHLAQAVVLLQEAQQGYPEHRWLAIGHLGEAADEIIQALPQVAASIREHRKRLEVDPAYPVPGMLLIEAIGLAVQSGKCKGCGQKQSAPVAVQGGIPKGLLPPTSSEVMPSAPEAGGIPGALPPMEGDIAELAAAFGAHHVRGVKFPEPGPGVVFQRNTQGEIIGAIEKPEQQAQQQSQRQRSPPTPEDRAARRAEVRAKMEQARAARRPAGMVAGRLVTSEELDQAIKDEDTTGIRGISTVPKESAHLPFPVNFLIATCLGEFSSNYSLATVIRDQITAADREGIPTTVLLMEGTKIPEWGAELRRISWAPQMPHVGWKEDELDAGKINKLTDFLKTFITSGKFTHILTHDWLLQSWYTCLAAAVHACPVPDSVQWFHQIHSLVGQRPENPLVARVRAQLPRGHRLVSVNTSFRRQYADYYQIKPEQILHVPNIRDLRTGARLSPAVKHIVDQTRLLETEFSQILPVDSSRMMAKGVDKVVRFFGGLRRQQPGTVRLVIVNSDAFGKPGRDTIEQITSIANEAGLTVGVEVAFTSQLLQQIQGSTAKGLPSEDVLDLMRFTNLFVFASLSEACGLTMLESALNGHFLVLNQDLPQLQEYIPHDTPRTLWLPFGSQQAQTDQIDIPAVKYDAWAKKLCELETGNTARRNARKRVLGTYNLDTLGRSLCALLDIPMKA